MHAWQFESYGRYTDVLRWSERADPVPAADQAVLRTRAVSLNFPDLLLCEGRYQVRAPLPAVPGVEGIGVVESAGAESRFSPGQRVVGFNLGGGTLGEYFTVDNRTAWAVPDGVSDSQAAALSVTYGTSYFGLVHRAHLQPGEVLLVLGGAGGVGTAAIQLGKVLGAYVIAAAGTQAKLEVCLQQGADAVIDYRAEDLVERVRALTDGRGADVIYDPVGGELFDQTKRCVAWEGRLLVVGFAGGSIPKMECNRVLLKNMALVGLVWGEWIARDPAKGARCQHHLYDLLRAGAIDPVIYRALPLAEAHEGLRLIESREVYGKVVLTC